MADIENPDEGGGEDVMTPEADGESGWQRLCATALITCILVGIGILPVLFYRGHRTSSLGLRILAILLLIPGTMVLALAFACCISLVTTFFYGNDEGKPQDQEPLPPQAQAG